eukprot:TRINITY_DN14905_c0_g1_i1.p1 TRINITY_DN14905_c0_g1~~TRINITY_DN14905_c0_g1_i1.p1  ORF type:complete len:128 (+),score=17.23 TRINITY_DN14905_c0_g1_i1:74-457(+)
MFSCSSLFRIWCTRTHSHGEKRVRIYEDEMGKKHTSSMQTVVAEYPMPFSFVETSVTNTSINIQVVDSNVQVIAISVVLCNYLNQVVPDGLQTKYDRRPQTVSLTNSMAIFLYCKESLVFVVCISFR